MSSPAGAHVNLLAVAVAHRPTRNPENTQACPPTGRRRHLRAAEGSGERTRVRLLEQATGGRSVHKIQRQRQLSGPTEGQVGQ